MTGHLFHQSASIRPESPRDPAPFRSTTAIPAARAGRLLRAEEQVFAEPRRVRRQVIPPPVLECGRAAPSLPSKHRE